eukprot:2252015-Alexandrium_andersonii.AAC.1
MSAAANPQLCKHWRAVHPSARATSLKSAPAWKIGTCSVTGLPLLRVCKRSPLSPATRAARTTLRQTAALGHCK